MPELPEVEVVRRQLEPAWVGQRAVRVWTSQPSYFFVTSPGELRKRLTGRTTVQLARHGKYLVAELDDASRLLCHLGMTGQMTTRRLERDAHVHLELHLGSAQCITFRDVRKFGKVEWIPPGGSSARLDKLGPDALTVSGAVLARGLFRRGIPIKSALLDQSILAGVGNIYADEALFAARVGPLVPARELAPAHVTAIARHVRRILGRSVARGGSTINDYLQPDGELGSYQNWHKVYGKEGEPCPRCRHAIVRIVVATRSTHYCPKCQPLD